MKYYAPHIHLQTRAFNKPEVECEETAVGIARADPVHCIFFFLHAYCTSIYCVLLKVMQMILLRANFDLSNSDDLIGRDRKLRQMKF
jgi:hypothetical protein